MYIAVRLSVAEAESSRLGQVRALGDAALIRWHGEWFSLLALWFALKIPLVAPLLLSCANNFHTDKPLKNPSRCAPWWCALVLYTISLWLCTEL